mgnify:CR=1 FL=1
MNRLLKTLLAASLLSLTMGSVAMASPNSNHHRAKHQAHTVVKKVHVMHHSTPVQHRPAASRGFTLLTVILGR